MYSVHSGVSFPPALARRPFLTAYGEGTPHTLRNLESTTFEHISNHRYHSGPEDHGGVQGLRHNLRHDPWWTRRRNPDDSLLHICGGLLQPVVWVRRRSGLCDCVLYSVLCHHLHASAATWGGGILADENLSGLQSLYLRGRSIYEHSHPSPFRVADYLQRGGPGRPAHQASEMDPGPRFPLSLLRHHLWRQQRHGHDFPRGVGE